MFVSLEDILSYADENKCVEVRSYHTDKVLSRYDGKDSIDPMYNVCPVITITNRRELMQVWIDERTLLLGGE